MDWLDRMNFAIDYIEEHLTEDIDLNQVAKMAFCSSYHFQRMFSFLTEVPLSEYIRRRRLTLAAFELQNSDVKIIDLAAKYGYGSHESFSRAFYKLHGIMPRLARIKGAELKAFPRMTFQISIKGAVEMNYRIEEKSAFEVCGFSAEIETSCGKSYVQIPEFWNESTQNGSIRLFNKKLGLEKDIYVYSAVYNFRSDGFSYMICYDVPESGIPEGYECLSVPGSVWAIFTTPEYRAGKTVVNIQDIWKRIFTEWFPASGYEHSGAPEIEKTFSLGHGNYYSEVWVPVVEKTCY